MLVSILICFSFYCHYTVRSYDQLLNTSTWKDPLHVQKQQCLANQEPSPPTADPQGFLFNPTKFQFHKFTDFFFIVCCFTFHWILLHSYGDIDIANEWLKNLGFSQHLQLLSRKPKRSLCICYDIGPHFLWSLMKIHLSLVAVYFNQLGYWGFILTQIPKEITDLMKQEKNKKNNRKFINQIRNNKTHFTVF